MTVLTEEHEPIFRVTAEEFDRIRHVFADRDDDVRVELLDGVLIEIPSENPPHALAVSLLARWLVRGVTDDSLLVRLGAPITLPPYSQPQPDFAVADLAPCIDGHPLTAHFVIEVSDTSLRTDRNRKARIYAAYDLPLYWIVDLVHNAVIVHTDPGPDGYGKIETVAPPAVLDPGTCGIPPLDLAELFKHL